MPLAHGLGSAPSRPLPCTADRAASRSPATHLVAPTLCVGASQRVHAPQRLPESPSATSPADRDGSAAATRPVPSAPAASPGAHAPGRSFAPSGPAPAGPEAVQLCSDELLYPMAIERAIGHQPLQLAVVFPQLPQLPQLAQPQARIFELPRLKRRSAIPACRQTSATVVPPSACRKTARICSSVCPRRVLLLDLEDHVAGHFLKLSLAYFSGFGSARCVSCR